MGIVNYTFTADAQNSGSINARDNELIALSLEFGGASATVDLERKIGGGSWLLLEQITGDTEKNIEAVSKNCVFRCSTSAWASGAVVMNMAAPG